METHTLRIGNAVLHNRKVITVKNITPKSINLEFDPKTHPVTGFIPASEIRPIPITREALYKMGFKENYTRFEYSKMDRGVFVYRKAGKYYISLDHDYRHICEVESVHQLQNIFMDWFGVELRYGR